MKKNSKKIILIACGAIIFLGFVALVVHNYKTKTSFKFFKEKPEDTKVEEIIEGDAISEEIVKQKLAETRKNSDLMKIQPYDYVLGESSAKVLVIEYASLSCPHCAVFYREAFERLNEEYIKTGKVRFIFRDFPLNQQALIAGAVAECVALDDKKNATEKYLDTIKILFKSQDSWAFDVKYQERLEAIMKLDGMGSDRFNACISNKQIQDKILAKRMDASNTLQIRSTPTFFINGEISEGYVDYVTLQKIIEKNLK